MANVKASVILPYKSGLSADVSVNTFYFVTDDTVPGSVAVGDFLIDLYNTTEIEGSTLAVPALSTYFSTFVDRENAYRRFVEFDPATGLETGPEFLEDMPLQNATNTPNVPQEVAVCLSYRGDFVSGAAKGRNRGRVYFGPFNTSVVLNPDNEAPRPPSFFTNDLPRIAAKAARIATDAGAVPSLYSRTDGELKTIRYYEGDNEFDTQRRRQVKATSRGQAQVAITFP